MIKNKNTKRKASWHDTLASSYLFTRKFMPITAPNGGSCLSDGCLISLYNIITHYIMISAVWPCG